MKGDRHIKINFIDFWPGFQKDDNFFYHILTKYYDVEISKEPDFVFCSCFSRKHFQYQNCVKIYYTGENLVPDFNVYDYALGFHYLDFEDRYLRLPHYVLYDDKIPLALKKHTYEDSYYLSKTKFCNYVVSNPNADSRRDAIIDVLSKYSPVDSGGRYRNNVGGPVEDKLSFAKQYRFSIAFENSATNGYTTEKILEAFAADTIPIYWGSRDITKEFNKEAFINCMDYPDFEAVAERVKEINENPELYLAMMKAPMVTEESEAFTCLKADYTDKFLRHIFDQEPEKAIRRNMVYLGLDYQNKMKDACKAADVLDLVKKPVHLLQKKRSQRKS